MARQTIWNDEKIAMLRELFPTMPAGDIGDRFGCTGACVLLKAKELGLKKDPSFHAINYYGRYTGKPKRNPADEHRET